MQTTDVFRNEVELSAGETARLHMTKSGKLIAMAYPAAISYSHVGLKTVKPSEDRDLNKIFLDLLKAG